MDTIETRLKKYNEISHIWTTLGTQGQTAVGVNLAMMNIKLVEKEKRGLSSREVAGNITGTFPTFPRQDSRIVDHIFDKRRADVECYLVGRTWIPS